ncbi:MAG TPA: hypothetical protein VFX13_01970 [Gaiellales bacterium]|nr:hypothetical protein [Gaiellales bacterium]
MPWEVVMGRFVHLLWHTHELADGSSDEKLLGVYSTHEQAQARIEQARLLPGFGEAPGGFEVVEYELDRDDWVEGYRTDEAGDVPSWFAPGGGEPADGDA